MALGSGKIKKGHSNYGLGSLWRESGEMSKLSRSAMLAHLGLQAWKSFVSSPLTSILTVVTISVTLLVFAVFVLFIENVRDLVSTARKDTIISLYLKEDLAAGVPADLMGEIKKLPYVESVTFNDKNRSLQQFQEELGDRSAILEGLEDNNPLPASISVQFKKESEGEDFFTPFAEKYSQDPSVEHVGFSRGLVNRLNNLLRFFRLAGTFSIIFMLIITGFIITNTIKLALYSHREEIEIMKLVGATDAFVRAPYMIEGFFQGLIGGICSIFITYAIFLFVQDSLRANEILRVFIPNIHFLSGFSVFLVILSGIAVGICGSYWAVKKFIVY